MRTTDPLPSTHPAGPPAAGAPAPGPAELPTAHIDVPAQPADPAGAVEIERWFDRHAADRTHPVVVSGLLTRAGWSDAAAQWAEARYRNRWPDHPAIWWGGFTAIGMAVLSAVGVAHSLIDGERSAAAGWFSVALVAWVFAGVSVGLITRVAGEWSQTFSAARRSAATVLFWCAIAAAVFRGLWYGQVLGEQLLVGDDCRNDYVWDDTTRSSTTITTCEDRTVDAFAHLALTATAATPVALWAWYAHRRPTDPPELDPAGVSGGAA